MKAAIHRARDVLEDPFVAREIFWCIVAACAVWLVLGFRIAFAYERLYLLFASKVPFLGLIITAGTFQYRTWRELADREQKRLTDPQWLALERRVEDLRAQVVAARAAGQPMPADVAQLPAWEEALSAWRASGAEAVEFALNASLPHARALLGNFLFVGVCLLLSSSADAVLFLVGRDVESLRAISSALFVVIILPFAESTVRYFLSLYWEFGEEQRWLQEQHDKASAHGRHNAR